MKKLFLVLRFAISALTLASCAGKKAPKEYLNEAFDAIKGTHDTSFKALKSETEFLQNLEDNCIPVGILDMDYTQYQSFLEARRAKMTELIKQYYYSL